MSLSLRIEPEQAIAILKLLHVEDASAEVASLTTGIDEQSLAAAEVMRQRRPNLDFREMGIPDGAVLDCLSASASVTVSGPKKVKLGDTEMSLTAATRQVLQLDYSVQPSPHWAYQGKSLQDLYEEAYGEL